VILIYLFFAIEGEKKENKPATFPVSSQQRKKGLGIRASQVFLGNTVYVVKI